VRKVIEKTFGYIADALVNGGCVGLRNFGVMRQLKSKDFPVLATLRDQIRAALNLKSKRVDEPTSQKVEVAL